MIKKAADLKAEIMQVNDKPKDLKVTFKKAADTHYFPTKEIRKSRNNYPQHRAHRSVDDFN